MKIIRVAHIIGKWLGGGVESVVMNYYRSIDRTKIQFDFLCDCDSTNIPYEEIERLKGRVILIPPYQNVLEYQKELIRIFKENHYEIVHSHINTLSLFPLRAAKKAGVPVRIAHSHSTSHKKEWKRNLMKQTLRPFSKVYATDYFACTQFAGRWLFGNKAFQEGKVTVINNAINLDKFTFNEQIRKQKRSELEFDEDVFVVGHIGRFVEQKNHEFLIEIFNEIYKKNKKTVLLLVGQGPLLEKMKQKVEELQLSHCVKFLGQRDDVEDLYQVFDVFLFPSLYEGLGLVLIEAQATGLPCVASKEVPAVAKVTNNFEFMDLKESSEKWENKVLSFQNIERKDHKEEIQLSGYDIEKEVKKLEKKYLR